MVVAPVLLTWTSPVSSWFWIYTLCFSCWQLFNKGYWFSRFQSFVFSPSFTSNLHSSVWQSCVRFVMLYKYMLHLILCVVCSDYEITEDRNVKSFNLFLLIFFSILILLKLIQMLIFLSLFWFNSDILFRYYIQLTKCFLVALCGRDSWYRQTQIDSILKMDIQLSIECILDYNFGN